MSENPYDSFDRSNLILRDYLAIDRTVLANERTALAYCRTALTLVIVGLSFIHFVQSGYLYYIGILFIPVGIITGLFGYFRFVKMKRRLRSIRNV